MKERFKKIANYLSQLRDNYNVQICIKDYCGFIPINKDLDQALFPFLTHTNPFCMYMKEDPDHYRTCLTMIRKMHDHLERKPATYMGMCHAGLCEIVIPIFSDDILLGSVNAGFFQLNNDKTLRRIEHTCNTFRPLDQTKAKKLYESYIRSATISPEAIIPGLEMLAEYLGQTYTVMRNTHQEGVEQIHFHNSSEDTILTHALEYIRLNMREHISVNELADFCHCSDSYLSRIFKKRTGVNINTYINKMRVELSKNYLQLSDSSIADISSTVGFNDPNYFSRVFTQIMGISPKEFRIRFKQEF